MEFFLVGGAVRDRLLGVEPEERDWVVLGATPKVLESRGFRRLDSEFPVFAHPETGEEYALARRERKTGKGHKGFSIEFGPDVTLEEDLRRRDLRVNAIAQSESGELIDPFDGRGDIEARVLRHVSPAFSEDPLRVLRTARFAARFAKLGFEIDAGTRSLMNRMSSSADIRSLSAGRIWREIDKALRTDQPAKFFGTLSECGALEVVAPEFGLGQDQEALSFALSALDAAAEIEPSSEVRFATLVNAVAGSDAGRVRLAIERLAERFAISRRYAELASIIPFVRTADGDAASVYSGLKAADAFRRPDRFANALKVCRALDDGTQQAERLQRSFDAASRISGDEVIETGKTGAAAGVELKRRRMEAIKAALSEDFS